MSWQKITITFNIKFPSTLKHNTMQCVKKKIKINTIQKNQYRKLLLLFCFLLTVLLAIFLQTFTECEADDQHFLKSKHLFYWPFAEK